MRIASVALIVVAAFAAQGQAEDPAQADRRLAAAGKAWGRIAYLHPALHSPRVDWDGAFIAAVPDIVAAKDAAAYRSAVERMVAVLGDPITRVMEQEAKPDDEVAAPPAPTAEFVTTADGRVTISCLGAMRLLAGEGGLFPHWASLDAALANAKSTVIDCRKAYSDLAARDRNARWKRHRDLQAVAEKLVSVFMTSPLELPSMRYRVHSGFVPERGSTSGGYTSTMAIEAPKRIAGNSAARTLPLVVVLDEDASVFAPYAAALEAAGRARTIEHTPADGPSMLWAGSVLLDIGDGLAIRMRSSELAFDGAGAAFTPFASTADLAALPGLVDRALKRGKPSGASRAPAARPPIFTAWQDAKVVGEGERVFALVKAWTVIDMFFPYRALMDAPVEGLLLAYMPRFRGATDNLAYHSALEAFGTELDDSHVGVYFDEATPISELLGLGTLPIAARFVGERAYLVPLKDLAPLAALGLAVGDEIVAIDGKPVLDRVAALAPFQAASTRVALLDDVASNLLRGPLDSVATLDVRGVDGKLRTVSAKRDLPYAKGFGLVREPEHEGPVWRRLDGGAGYIDLTRLEVMDADKALDELSDAPALILDMRGYPRGTAWSVAPRLGDHVPGAVAARFRRPFVDADITFDDGAFRPDYSFEQRLPVSDKPRYKGRVVVLIDARAISQSEHSCMFFEVATKVTFVGSQTTGANGDVTSMRLPGGATLRFTGHDVRHADGRQLQRVGITPDVTVLPTPAGMRAGRDEVLEAAVALLASPADARKAKAKR